SVGGIAEDLRGRHWVGPELCSLPRGRREAHRGACQGRERRARRAPLRLGAREGAVSAFDLDAYLKERRQLVDAALDGFLPREDTPPPSVHRAMRYSVLAGGKRLRPILVIAGAELVGAQATRVMPAACAPGMSHPD